MPFVANMDDLIVLILFSTLVNADQEISLPIERIINKNYIAIIFQEIHA